jgi:hypothetical protein
MRRTYAGTARDACRRVARRREAHPRAFHLGVEVVQTVDQSYLDAKRRMEETTESVRAELESRGICGYIQICFDVNEILSTPPAQRRRVPKQIAAFLDGHQGTNFETPELKADGVQCVARIERMAAPKTVVHRGWRSQSLNGSLAAICLQKKDERLRHYRSENGDSGGLLDHHELGESGQHEDAGFLEFPVTYFDERFDTCLTCLREISSPAASVTACRMALFERDFFAAIVALAMVRVSRAA